VLWGPANADATAALRDGSTVQLLLRQRSSQEEYRVPAEVELRVVDAPGGGARAIVAARGRVDARTAAAGGPLAEGAWEVHAMVIVAGFRAAARVRRSRGAEHLMLAVGPDGHVAERRPGWQRNLRRRMPRPLVRAIRQTQRTVRRRARR
jgi:hypothetical protein